MDEKLQALGQRLKQARLERNDSQKEFACRIGVSIPTLHKMEKGDPSIPLGKWARALEIFGNLEDLDKLLSPGESLAQRYEFYQKTHGRQRAGKKK